MSKQSYGNHVRYYPPYHFILVPLTLGFLGLCVYLFVREAIYAGAWAQGAFYLLVGLIVTLAVALLRLTPLKLQDRIVRNEVKFRYFVLSGKSLNGGEKDLRTSQLIALRFASDEELPRLVEQAIQEGLPPQEIKKRIRKWRGDYHRV